jgi:hypothetical protein
VYQALQIAFEYQGLNKEALKGMLVYADLVIGQAVNTTGENFNGQTWPVTSPVGNYSEFTINGTNYEYLWEIQTHYSTSRSIPPLGFTLTFVDASTGRVLPSPPVG